MTASRSALAAVRREASRLAASADVEEARRNDADAALARERAARADDAAAHAAALGALQAVVASKVRVATSLFSRSCSTCFVYLQDAEISQLRLALANRPFTSITGRDSAEGEVRASEAEARAARAERALAASRAVEAELSSLLLAERRREPAFGRDVASSPAGSRAAVERERGSATANASGRGTLQALSATRPREGRLPHVSALLSAALEAQ